MSGRPNHKPQNGYPVRLGLLTVVLVCAAQFAGGGTPEHSHAFKTAPASSGYVEKVTGDMNGIRIERNGKLIPVAILLPLQAGDRVSILASSNELVAQLGNRRIVISRENSPYDIPATDAPPSFLTRLRTSLTSVGSKLTTQYARSSAPVSTSSRGHEGPLSIPLIEDKASRISAHRTGLHLSWEGGTPPFLVRILTGQQAELARLDVKDAWRASLALQPGLSMPKHVRIVIDDAEGHHMEKGLESVPSAALPHTPPALSEHDLPLPLQTVLEADALIQKNRKQWRFEAYQRLVPFAESYEPARLLRDCLESVPSCYLP